jgi:hypothetical protein
MSPCVLHDISPSLEAYVRVSLRPQLKSTNTVKYKTFFFFENTRELIPADGDHTPDSACGLIPAERGKGSHSVGEGETEAKRPRRPRMRVANL